MRSTWRAVRSTNLNSAPSVALFNGSTDKCTALVHSAVGTRMHASFTRRSALSGPMCASCAPAARGGRAFGAEIIFIIFIIPGTTMVNKPRKGYLNMLGQLFHAIP